MTTSTTTRSDVHNNSASMPPADSLVDAGSPTWKGAVGGVRLPDLRGINRGLRVLIVEDSEVDAELICETLRLDKRVERVVYADNGEKALEILQDYAPDLIFTDLSMPVLSGVEFLKRLRAWERSRPKDIFVAHDAPPTLMPIVVLTSSSQIADFHAAVLEEANCFVTKPSSYADLRKILRTVIRTVIWGEEMPRYLSSDVLHARD